MGWFSEDELSNFQLVEYFVSANIWRLVTGACMIFALYCCYTGAESHRPRPTCHKKANRAANQAVAVVEEVKRKPSATATTHEPDEDQPHTPHGLKMVFNGPVHVVMPTNLGKVFDEWDYEHQDCRSELF